MNGLTVRSKIWLEVDGEPLLGGGRERLLNLIQETRSISSAARAMEIPYRKAWSYIRTMETKIGFPLVLRQKGGAGGGESVLTAEAADLLKKFDLLRKNVNRSVDVKFARIFGPADGSPGIIEGVRDGDAQL